MKTDSPLVSFVVPCYNYGRYLPDCLNSIFALQGNYTIEVIAIDDCSQDNTRELLAGIRDPRLRTILHQENKGHVFTVNEGLQETRGKYVVRIDPDDRYRPNFLVDTVPKLERYPDVGLVYGDVAMIDQDGKINCESCDVVHNGSDFKGSEFIALLKNNFICAPSVIARREAWMSAWPIPEGLAFNDWYFNIMLARRYEFYYVNRVVADYRVHGANHHTTVARDRTEEASVIRILDQVFAETETDAQLEKVKRRCRAQIYAEQNLGFAENYFWFCMNQEARRCYFRAFALYPALALRPGVLRRATGALMFRGGYNQLKKLGLRLLRRKHTRANSLQGCE